MKWGYDIDGVLAAQPPASDKKWGHMNGQERNARKQFLVEWYLYAEPLYSPPQKAVAISARKNTEEINSITGAWLSTHRPQITHYYLLNSTRTLDNVAAYKSQVLTQEAVTDYVEDNKQILKRIKKLNPDINLYHWEKGMQEPIPYE